MAKIIKFPSGDAQLEKDFHRLDDLMREYDAVAEQYKEYHVRLLELGFAVQQATYSLAFVHGIDKVSLHYPHLLSGGKAPPPTQLDFQDVFDW